MASREIKHWTTSEVAHQSAQQTPFWINRDDADHIVAQANAEVVRLRTGLNQIGWPVHYGIHSGSIDVALCQKIAQDTLSSGPVVNENRAYTHAELPTEILDAFKWYTGGNIMPPVVFDTFVAGFRSALLARTRNMEQAWIRETEKARDITAPAVTLAKLVQDMHRNPKPPGQRQDAALFAAERILAAFTDSNAGGNGDGSTAADSANPTSTGDL